MSCYRSWWAAVVGILAGITGTGGAFVIPALIYLFRVDQLRARRERRC
jgi:uncharacterized membrane protein YfcA